MSSLTKKQLRLNLYEFIKIFIDKDVLIKKHKTNTGHFLGYKYTFNLKNTKRSSPLEVIEFDDGLCYFGFSAWVSQDIIKKILLVLKKIEVKNVKY